jgi:hypothetical protein
MSQSRIDRDRHLALDALVNRIVPRGDDSPATLLLTTTTITTYPTSASAFYAGNPTQVSGTETEGGAASYAPDIANIVLALNLGTQIPAAGTRVIATAAGGRWTFRYDG